MKTTKKKENIGNYPQRKRIFSTKGGRGKKLGFLGKFRVCRENFHNKKLQKKTEINRKKAEYLDYFLLQSIFMENWFRKISEIF